MHILSLTYTRNAPIEINAKLSSALDFLRWFSAFLVLIGHVRAMLFVPYDQAVAPNILVKAFYLLTGFGHQAVMIFLY